MFLFGFIAGFFLGGCTVSLLLWLKING